MQIFSRDKFLKFKFMKYRQSLKLTLKCVCCLLLLSCLTTYGAGSRAAELLCPSEYMCAVAAQTVICSASPPSLKQQKFRLDSIPNKMLLLLL